MDEVLFDFFKAEIKQLKSKLSASILRDIRKQKVVVPDCYDPSHPEFDLKSRLVSLFGGFMNDELLGGVSVIFDKYCSSIPTKQKEYENMVVDILKLVLAGLSDNNAQFCTPICKSKRKVDDSFICPAIAKQHVKKFFRVEDVNICRRGLFQSSQKLGENKSAAIGENSKTVIDLDCDEVVACDNMYVAGEDCQKSPEVFFLKENNFKDKLNQMCSNADDIYNEKFVDVKGLRNEKGRSNATNQASCSISFVSQEFCNNHFGVDGSRADCADQCGKFPVTAQQKKNYDVVCKLACSRHSKEVIVDIGGCTLWCFSLGDSMAQGKEVCTYVVNCICRKFFLDERPTISLKHYFFSCVSIVFMNDSDDYSYVGKCFSGAAKVLPLPCCEMAICLS